MHVSLSETVKRDVKRLRKKYLLLKIKWFLLFVLPILIIIIAYQAAKQFLKLKIKSPGGQAPPENPEKNSAESSQVTES